jgi:Na+/H+ antiporter NhaC
MFTTYFLGLAIFFDDYANTLVVGNTMRPITDKLKISREKLAYIVDSTAAPIAAVAFITTWIGAELTYISDGVAKITAEGGEITESAYSIFVSSLGYSYYPIFTLFFVGFIIYKQRDFGPMFHAEKNAANSIGNLGKTESIEELNEFKPVENSNHKSMNAVLPILCVVLGTFIGLLYTGFKSVELQLVEMGSQLSLGVWSGMEELAGNPTTFFRKLGLIVGNADTYVALLWASLLGLFCAIILTVSQRIMNLKDTMESLVFGIKTMVPAIVILVLAWSLALITEDLNTAGYLKTFFGEDFKTIWLIPALTFVLSAFIAFSTGSSWSTMALMYPLVIPLSFSVAGADLGYDEFAILYNTIASVLAGAVLGDHCSPISDTTILSSLATSCDHISHVRTQMPYALTVGGVALFIGVIPAALGISSFILIPLGIVVLYAIVHFFGKE